MTIIGMPSVSLPSRVGSLFKKASTVGEHRTTLCPKGRRASGTAENMAGRCHAGTYCCHRMHDGWHRRRTSAGLVTHCVHRGPVHHVSYRSSRHYTPLHTRHHTPRQTRSRCCQSVQRFRNTRMRSGNSRIKQIAGKCSPPKVALIYEGEWQVTALYSFDARTSCCGRLQQRRAKCPCVALPHDMHATGRCGCVFIVAFRVHACTGTSTALLFRCVERSNLLSHVHTLRLALCLIQVLEH